ncbi:MAG TPA: hypothetical protein VLE27_02710, partial [Thermoanaerobaculia bacterium]|nr:hypothetical protein [Thermoanaerobaculia bacterium]
DKASLLKTIFPKQVEAGERAKAQGREDGDSCEDAPRLYGLDHLAESTYLYNFSPQGLEIQPDWPHAIEACAERVTVPYERLREFAAPGGLLERVLAKKPAAAVSTPPKPPELR